MLVTNGVKLTENQRFEFIDWFVKRIEESRRWCPA
jgi:hypothetical protein